jgi:hypothetical protein
MAGRTTAGHEVEPDQRSLRAAMLVHTERRSPHQIPTHTLSPHPVTRATSVIKSITTEFCVAAEFGDVPLADLKLVAPRGDTVSFEGGNRLR